MIFKLNSTWSLFHEPVSGKIAFKTQNFIGYILRENIILVMGGPFRDNGLDWYYVHAGDIGTGWLAILANSQVPAFVSFL